MTEDWKTKKKPNLTKLTCTSTDCNNNLHCFLRTQTMKTAYSFGQCRECGARLVDGERVHKRDLNDIQYTFEALKSEKFRHYYWHKDIDQTAINHARRKGVIELREAAKHRLKKYVGEVHEMKDGQKRPYRDGQQTPLEGNSIYYAQHATACCCRKCMEDWHNIPQGRDLTEEELEYFTNLVMLYIEERLPLLTQNGEQVPRIKNDKS